MASLYLFQDELTYNKLVVQKQNLEHAKGCSSLHSAHSNTAWFSGLPEVLAAACRACTSFFKDLRSQRSELECRDSEWSGHKHMRYKSDSYHFILAMLLIVLLACFILLW